MKNKNSSKTGYALIFTAGLFFGLIGPGLQVLTNLGLNALQASFFLQFFAFVSICPVILFKCGIKALKIDLKLLPVLIITGICSEALFDIFFTLSVNRVGVATAGVLMYTSPIFVMIVSRFLFKEAITKRKILALIVNLLGCVLTVTGGSFKGASFSVGGVIFGLLAAICYGVLTISDKYTAGKSSPEVLSFYMFLFGVITLGLISRVWTFTAEIITPKNLLAGLLVGLLSTMIPFIIFAKGLTYDVEASKATVFASVEVIVSAILGVVLFSEQLGIFNILGIIIVISSIVILNKE